MTLIRRIRNFFVLDPLLSGAQALTPDEILEYLNRSAVNGAQTATEFAHTAHLIISARHNAGGQKQRMKVKRKVL